MGSMMVEPEVVQENVVRVKSIMDMRLAAYQEVIKGEPITCFEAVREDYLLIVLSGEALKAFVLNAKGEPTIFGIPFKMAKD